MEVAAPKARVYAVDSLRIERLFDASNTDIAGLWGFGLI
jgi:hypothetical protein